LKHQRRREKKKSINRIKLNPQCKDTRPIFLRPMHHLTLPISLGLLNRRRGRRHAGRTWSCRVSQQRSALLPGPVARARSSATRPLAASLPIRSMHVSHPQPANQRGLARRRHLGPKKKREREEEEEEEEKKSQRRTYLFRSNKNGTEHSASSFDSPTRRAARRGNDRLILSQVARKQVVQMEWCTSARLGSAIFGPLIGPASRLVLENRFADRR